jgi:hypothetical protein
MKQILTNDNKFFYSNEEFSITSYSSEKKLNLLNLLPYTINNKFSFVINELSNNTAK